MGADGVSGDIVSRETGIAAVLEDSSAIVGNSENTGEKSKLTLAKTELTNHLRLKQLTVWANDSCSWLELLLHGLRTTQLGEEQLRLPC